jgi:hypothetical protein
MNNQKKLAVVFKTINEVDAIQLQEALNDAGIRCVINGWHLSCVHGRGAPGREAMIELEVLESEAEAATDIIRLRARRSHVNDAVRSNKNIPMSALILLAIGVGVLLFMSLARYWTSAGVAVVFWSLFVGLLVIGKSRR